MPEQVIECDRAAQLIAMDEGRDQHLRAGATGLEGAEVRHVSIPGTIGGDVRRLDFHCIAIRGG